MKLWYLLSYSVLFLLMMVSCVREETVEVKVDFTVSAESDNYSFPAKIKINNKTTGADNYQWTFEGTSISSSTDRDPQTLIFPNKGQYKITLKAQNRDGKSDEKTIEIEIKDPLSIDFDWSMTGSDIAPVSLQMNNKSIGAVTYHWEFEGGIPNQSTSKNPNVAFNQPGDYKIKLTVEDGRITKSLEKIISIKEMKVGFDWTVDYIDHDYEAPVKLYLKNTTTNATSYQWTIAGATPSSSILPEPIVNFTAPGTYTIKLTANYDKGSKTLEKQITINHNKNLLSFLNIKLGINTAHGSVGSFFSSTLGKVITKDEVSTANGNLIDFVYFGLNAKFEHNIFLSPNKLSSTTFSAIPNATKTKIINSQEAKMSGLQFNQINEGSDFNSITVTETLSGSLPFDQSLVPRIVLFQTQDGRKGAIKVKEFVSNGTGSYIVVDIKIQKQ